MNDRLRLYLLLLVLVALLVVLATGPVVLTIIPGLSGSWIYDLFQPVCHQHPDRSFWVSGYQMAVCNRCYGIYTGALSSLIALPFIDYMWAMSLKIKRWILLIFVMLNVVDIIVNTLHWWTNTHISRYTFGFLVGYAAFYLCSNDFNLQQLKFRRTIYE